MQYTIGVDTIISSGDALNASFRTSIHGHGAMTLNNRAMDPDDDTVSCGECRNAPEHHCRRGKTGATLLKHYAMPLDGFTMHSDAFTMFPECITLRLGMVTAGVKPTQCRRNGSQCSANTSQSTSWKTQCQKNGLRSSSKQKRRDSVRAEIDQDRICLMADGIGERCGCNFW